MKWLVPKCPLFRGSTVHKEEDRLSIVDEMAGTKVTFIQRVHCIQIPFLLQGVSLEDMDEVFSQGFHKRLKSVLPSCLT